MEHIIINEEYAKSKKWKGGKYLKFIIESNPVIFKKDKVPPNTNNSIFFHFDDETIILQLSTGKSTVRQGSYIWYGFALITIVSPIFFDLSNGVKLNFGSLLYPILIAILPASIGIKWQLKYKKMKEFEYVKFFRTLGLIELPGMDLNTSFVIHFTDLKAEIGLYTHSKYEIPESTLVFIKDYIPFSFFRKFKGNVWMAMNWIESPIAYWSFYVWYMDRNRPLPPGTAFDPYRKKDYERRKAEGFPPPLFESKIPIPEYVPENVLNYD